MSRRRTTRIHPLSALLPLAFVACASAGVENVQQFAGDGTMPRPVTFLVYDFATHADEALTDTFGPEYEAEAPSDDERREAQAIASMLSERLVAEMRERGINAERAYPSTNPPETALLVKGQFITIDEGQRRRRVLIGFGAGANELQVRLQVYQVIDGRLMRIGEADADAEGSRRPGMLVPIAGAIATGKAAGAVISGGLAIRQERTAGDLDDDVERLAKKLGEQARDFYDRQGWP